MKKNILLLILIFGFQLINMQVLLASEVNNSKQKMLILGIDGMDPKLTMEFVNRGLMPNVKSLINRGAFSPVETSFPPQSPVAWSDFSVGASSEVHGIYDFIHRDAETFEPFLSTTEIVDPPRTINFAGWRIPVSDGEVRLLRKGKPFWEYLAEKGIDTTVFKMPGNYPSKGKSIRQVSGLGTPDLRGGYGSFTVFTDSNQFADKNVNGGMIVKLNFEGKKAQSALQGPRNTLREDAPYLNVPVTIELDEIAKVVKLTVGKHTVSLREGEWSQWLTVDFLAIPIFAKISGIYKVYIKQMSPDIIIYLTPININPARPTMPIFSSKRVGEQLVKKIGPFYTQGLPEDTKALSHGIFTDTEYLNHSYQIIDERKRLLNYELERFAKLEKGFLFFYFPSLDLNSHMFWRTIDKKHPMYNNILAAKHGDTIQKLYVEFDRIVGSISSIIDMKDPNFSFLVMSDHGFSSFKRQVNLNTWLHQNGYLSLKDETIPLSEGFFENIDWDNTKAYFLGINSLYFNLQGREKFGSVRQSEKEILLRSLQEDLYKIVDPINDINIISDILVVPEEEKIENPHAPDMIIGWNLGYRSSWESVLGGMSPSVVRDNNDKWSGDHCIAPQFVPGVLITNQKIRRDKVTLKDITASILWKFKINLPAHMTGKNAF